ncbi:MAG: hypothetical protein ACRD3L_01955 [Terriglobales bacterium]
MSSFPLFPAVAVRRPVASVASNSARVFECLSTLPRLAEVTPASQLTARPTPEVVSSGVRELDALTGGLPRGCLTEVCGSVSSGRTSLLLAVLAAATQRQEACALVDVSDAFDPASAAMAAVNFASLLWIRCSAGQPTAERHKNKAHSASRAEDNVSQALRATDLLLQSGGFGLVIVDLGDVPLKFARRIPLTSWFRFQRAIEHTPTVLVVITQISCAQTCAALLLKVQAKKLLAVSCQPSALKMPPHAELLSDRQIETEILRSRIPRKPAQSAIAAFSTNTIRAG